MARLEQRAKRGRLSGSQRHPPGGWRLASLLDLELLDASFSFEDTIAAFAITSKLALILTGHVLGALFIRTLTLMRARALEILVFLEHGALRDRRPRIADAGRHPAAPGWAACAGMARGPDRSGAAALSLHDSLRHGRRGGRISARPS